MEFKKIDKRIFFKFSFNFFALFILLLLSSKTAHALAIPVITSPASTVDRLPTVAQGNQITIRWNAVSGSTGYLIRIDDRNSNSLVGSWNGSCSAPNAGDMCATFPASQTSYTFTGVVGHSYSLWMHNLDSNGVINGTYGNMYFTMVAPNSIPNCSNVSGPTSLVVGYPSTFTATHTSAQGDLAGIINIMRSSDNAAITQSPVKYFSPDTVTSGTSSFTWTPTAPGSYKVYCGSWNDSIAECRGEESKVDRPPRFLCSGPTTTKTVTVAANSKPKNIIVSIDGSTSISVIPNGTKTYAVKLYSSDDNGGNTISEQLLILNYQGVNADLRRGYFGWSSQGFKYFASNATQTKTCTGGGQAAINNNATYGGATYITLHSCSTGVSAQNRTTTFVVSFNTPFTKPLDNYFSAYTEDDLDLSTGWQQYGSVSLDLPKFGMTVPSEYAVTGQISSVEKIDNSYPNFPYLSDWWNGIDRSGIISDKCSRPNYIPMIYSTTSAEPPADCKDGRPIILGNECEQSGQCNSTEDQEYAMWQRFRTWPGPVILCNNLVVNGVESSVTRCSNLLARYKAQYGSLPSNAYLGIHIYGSYDPIGTNYVYTFQASTITSYYNLSTQYNLKRYIGEWGFVHWGQNGQDLSSFVVRDMDKLVGNIMTYFDPDIMMYFTTRVEPADNASFSINNLFNSNGTKTSVGTRYFNLYYP